MSVIEQILIKNKERLEHNRETVCVYLGKASYKQLLSECLPKYALPTLSIDGVWSACVQHKVLLNTDNIETVFGLEIIRVKGKRYKDYISVGIKE